jgi:hypothetical protein
MLTNQAGWIIGSLCTNPIPIKPAIVLPVPRSDNQRKTLTPGGQLLTAGWVKSYRKAVGIMVKKVPETPCIVLYRVFFARRGIDASNVIKTLLDAIFGQDGDSEAYPWCLPPAIDKANPRVEVWFVSL